MTDPIIDVDPDDPDNEAVATCAWFKPEQLTNSPLRDELTAMLPRLLPMLTAPASGIAVKDVATMFTDSPRRRVRRIRKNGVTAGMTAETGVEGVDLIGSKRKKKDTDAEDVAEKALALLRPEVDRLLASANRVDAMRDMVMAVTAAKSNAPDVHVHLESPRAPDVHVSAPVTVEAAKAPDVHVSPAEVTVPVTVSPAAVTVEAAKAPDVNVTVEAPPPAEVNVPVTVKPAAVKVEAAPAPDVHVTVEAPKAPATTEAQRTTARRMPDGSVVIERSDS